MKQALKEQPRNILPECIIPALALIFAIYYLTTITEVPWISQASAIIVSCLLLASIVAFAIRSASRIREGRETISFDFGYDSQLGDSRMNLKRLVLLTLTIAYVWFIEDLGFTLTTFIFLFSAITLLSSLANWRKALLISVSCSVIGYIVFIYFFETRFPRGPIEIWLKGWY